MLIAVPLTIQISKGEDGKQYRLNLNCYRNWHYQTSDKIKKRFCQQLEKDLAGVKFEMPVEIRFTLYKGNRRKLDRSNILSVVEKFFCDALVYYGCIVDDNDEYIAATHYRTGGVDKENPRVEIVIEKVIPILFPNEADSSKTQENN